MATSEVLRTKESWIQKRPNVCGGDACIRNTRHNVWGLEEWRRLGLSNAEILRRHPDLTQADLEAAWAYSALQPQEIERALWLNRVGLTDDFLGGVPTWVLVQGRQLGLSDEEIRGSFDPPLSQSVLDAAWAEYESSREQIDHAIRDHTGV